MTAAVTIDRALRDPNLLGAALGAQEPWATWVAVLRAAFGHPLTAQDRRAFDAVAGGREPPAERVAELWAIVGRRGGKSRMAAAVATYIAALLDHGAVLSAGETGYVLVLAASKKQAGRVLGYINGFFRSSPLLAGMVEGTTTEEIRLAGNIVVAVHTNDFRTVRGGTLLAAIFDEVAFWRDEATANPDTETYTAVLPGLITTRGILIGISSPYRRTGLLAQKHRDAYGQDDPGVLVVKGGTLAFNPTIDEAAIARARAADPTAALSEWDAEFRSDLAAFLSDELIDAAIDHGRPLELPPVPGVVYHTFVDASAGRHDAFSIGIGHREGDRFIADVIRGRRPPFDPKSVAAEYAALAREYRCTKVTGDAFAGEWVSSAFTDAGVEYRRSELPKSALYLESLPLFTRGAVSMPDLASLVRELRLLERRVARSGKDSVDHGVGGSDDHANALVGAMWCSRPPKVADVHIGLPISIPNQRYNSDTGEVERYGIAQDYETHVDYGSLTL